jgi:hypothetical protein
VVQISDWAADGASYRMHLYIVRFREGQDAETQVFTCRYWPLTRVRLDNLLDQAGFAEVAWHEPDATGFFQPIVSARVP